MECEVHPIFDHYRYRSHYGGSERGDTPAITKPKRAACFGSCSPGQTTIAAAEKVWWRSIGDEIADADHRGPRVVGRPAGGGDIWTLPRPRRSRVAHPAMLGDIRDAFI